MCRSDHRSNDQHRNRQSTGLIRDNNNERIMKTQSETGLAFTKSELAALNDNLFHDVNCGTTPLCILVTSGVLTYYLLAE